jgi:hypothetical protein
MSNTELSGWTWIVRIATRTRLQTVVASEPLGDFRRPAGPDCRPTREIFTVYGMRAPFSCASIIGLVLVLAQIATYPPARAGSSGTGAAYSSILAISKRKLAVVEASKRGTSKSSRNKYPACHAENEKLLPTRLPHTMAIQRDDVRNPDGVLVERYWRPVNSPALNEARKLAFILGRREAYCAGSGS